MKWKKCADRGITSILSALLVLGFCTFLSIPAHSQVTGATLSGAITDASGAVISGAQISIRNTATGITTEATSDSAGFYTVPNLPAGPYEVKIAAKGFSTAVSNVTLAVGASQTLNIPLKVGETSQTVVVTEAAPQIDLTSSTLTGQVESQTVVDLPLNGRDWTSLATLHPGVALIEEQMSYATSARGNRGFGAELTISGQRTTTNNYRLDGISVNDYANSGPGNVIGAALGTEAVQEFSVLTGGFSAEYGKAAGGIVNAITKSGTNGFHGDLYEFLRNSRLDARDYFTRSADLPRPEFIRNQFGASAGGPIIKDKTFIFGDYEGLRQVKGITTNIKVLSPNARQGIVGGTVPSANTGAGTPCTEPGGDQGHYLSAMAQVCVADVVAGTSTKQGILSMYPLPNSTVSGNKGQFVNNGVQRVPENFYTFRVDHKLSANDSLGGTYLFDNTYFDQPDAWNNDLLHSQTRRQTVVLQESHTFSPSVLNAARVGFSRTHVVNLQPAGAINPEAKDSTLGTAGQNAPEVNIPGFTRLPGGVGVGSYYLHTFNNYEFYDDAFWTHGAHTIKFGGGVEREQYNYEAFQNQGGLWKFPSLTAFLTDQPNHFEEGIPSAITPRELRQTLFAGYVQDDWRFRPNLTLNLGLRYEMATVINDAQGKITNLPTIAAADPQCGILFTSPFLGTLSGGHCGSVGPYYSNPTKRNFEPRVGFAWDPFKDGKTSVRGGFGIYDVLPLPGYFLLQENQSGPFMIFSSIDSDTKLIGQFPANGFNLLTNPPAGVTPGKLATSTIETHPHRNYVEEWNFNIQRQLTSSLSLTLGYVGSHGVHNLTRGDDGNMTQGVQTSAGLLFPCGYPAAPPAAVGAPPVPTPYSSCTAGQTGGTAAAGGGSNAQINQTNGIIRYIYWATDSDYHALNINLEKRTSHGLQFQVADTWGRSIDDSSSTIAGDTFEQGLNSLFYFANKALRGPSDFNVSNTLSINALYAIPTPQSWNGIAKSALGGWQVGGIIKYNTGVPTTPIIGGDPMGVGNGGADQFGIPNRVPGSNPVNSGSISGYINQNSFSLPMSSPANASICQPFGYVPHDPTQSPDPYNAGIAGTCANLLGDAGRNTITGPKLVNVDFSVIKNTAIRRISESFNVQFRAEFFNIFNRSNFLPPEPVNGSSGAQVFNQDGTPSAGGIDSLATPSRDVQFALKVIW